MAPAGYVNRESPSGITRNSGASAACSLATGCAAFARHGAGESSLRKLFAKQAAVENERGSNRHNGRDASMSYKQHSSGRRENRKRRARAIINGAKGAAWLVSKRRAAKC